MQHKFCIYKKNQLHNCGLNNELFDSKNNNSKRKKTQQKLYIVSVIYIKQHKLIPFVSSLYNLNSICLLVYDFNLFFMVNIRCTRHEQK